ncbi:MAG: hypothetical protein NVS9B15_06590 [Acidobacteriaceae bacterium]
MSCVADKVRAVAVAQFSHSLGLRAFASLAILNKSHMSPERNVETVDGYTQGLQSGNEIRYPV